MRTNVKTLAALVGIAVIATALPAQAATPTVSSKVKTQLLYLIEEEKLARDVYAALDAVFNQFFMPVAAGFAVIDLPDDAAIRVIAIGIDG